MRVPCKLPLFCLQTPKGAIYDFSKNFHEKNSHLLEFTRTLCVAPTNNSAQPRTGYVSALLDSLDLHLSPNISPDHIAYYILEARLVLFHELNEVFRITLRDIRVLGEGAFYFRETLHSLDPSIANSQAMGEFLSHNKTLLNQHANSITSLEAAFKAVTTAAQRSHSTGVYQISSNKDLSPFALTIQSSVERLTKTITTLESSLITLDEILASI